MLISLENVTVRFGDTTVLDGITASVNYGERIGLIGVNGAGKTTLLNAAINKILPDEGRVVKKTGLSIGYLEQNSGLNRNSTIIAQMRLVFQEVIDAGERMRRLEQRMKEEPDSRALQAEYAASQAFFDSRDGYGIEVRIKKVLNGMGFSDKALDMEINSLSGGEKTRLALAKLLLEEPELLILDEPTNHLDFRTLVWLEEYLRDYRGAILVVSHDRYFLDKLVNNIWELEDLRLRTYRGNYTNYKKQKEEYLLYASKEYEKQAQQIAHMEDYVQRNSARASTAARARSRVKQLARIERLDKPRTYTRPPSFRFEYGQLPVNSVISVDEIELTAGDLLLCRELSFEIRRGQKVALIGDNGTGKSTLMKALKERFGKSDNAVSWGKNVRLGYYDQENRDMSATRTVLDEVWTRFPSMVEYEVRGMLGRVLITGEEVYKRIGDLSGGERAKVGLAILMCGNYNVLLLDEPTNHLDLSARESLEAALMEFAGTVLFVSHDRYFINALAGRVMELNDKNFYQYEGNFADYQKYKSGEVIAAQHIDKTSKGQGGAKQRRAQEAEYRQKLSVLEKQIARTEERELFLNEEIAKNAANYELLSQFCLELEEVKALHEQYMSEWMELQE